jgi:hypothetical protein
VLLRGPISYLVVSLFASLLLATPPSLAKLSRVRKKQGKETLEKRKKVDRIHITYRYECCVHGVRDGSARSHPRLPFIVDPMAAITGMLPLSSYLMKEWNWWNECDMQ